jgi:hypothetical protein
MGVKHSSKINEVLDDGREMMERSRRISRGETELIPTLPRGKEYLG